MSNRPIAAIIGATGSVGKGIAKALQGAGWSLVAIGRDEAKLAALKRELGPDCLTMVGSVSDDAAAAHLAARVQESAPSLDAIVVSVNLPPVSRRLLDMSADALVDVFRGNVVTHFCAAKAFLPLLAPQGRYIALGGGMADFTFAGLGGVSICQAAQRNMFRFLALESEGGGKSVVELMLYSHIVDPADGDAADERSIRVDEVGTHVLAVLERPGDFPGPILTLKSRKQVGSPERAQ